MPGGLAAARLPDRIELAVVPTPLTEAPGLAAALGTDSLHVKRDDLTGFAAGGNKARPLGFLVAAACGDGADTLVTGGAVTSTFCAASAAAARRAGLACHLVMAGQPRHAPAIDLARAWGATIGWTRDGDRGSVDAGLPAAAAELAAAGRRPYVMPRGGATALGAAGFAVAAAELHGQVAEAGLRPDCLVVPVGSGCSLAGLIAGTAMLGWPWRLAGASVSRPLPEITGRVLGLAADCVRLLTGPAGRTIAEHAANAVSGGCLQLIDARGPGHGLASADGTAAAEAALRTAGLAADPAYTAKALAAVPATGARRPVFWHTGGLLDLITAAQERL